MSEPVAIDLKNCTIIFRDGTSPTPEEIEIKIDDGNISYTAKRNLEAKLDRGVIDYLKEGDQVPLAVTLEARFSKVRSKSGEDISIYEFLTQTGEGASLVSTGGVCAAYTIDIVVENNQPCGTAVDDEVITFEDFGWTDINPSFKDGKLSVQGICAHVHPSSVRTAL